MKRTILLLLFSVHFLCAQKTVKKVLINPEISAIEIDANNCFEIRIKTANTDELLVKASIEGEYKNSLTLNLKENGPNVSVSAGFGPDFKNPNDKLGAHKIISIALEIIVPKFQNVQINGKSCNVAATGIYKQLQITLNDGACALRDVSEKVTATTQSGNIYVESKKAEINAVSKFGKVQENDIPTGRNYFALTTTTGNIDLKRTE